MKLEKKQIIISIIMVLYSAFEFVVAHIVFGTEYVLKYFVSIFFICLIPMWAIAYIFLEKIYNNYYHNCIEKIFEGVENCEKVKSKIFGLNIFNIIISFSITIIIFLIYIYFGENKIVFFPNKVSSYIGYAGGIGPILIGSFAAAIMIRSMVEAGKLLYRDIKGECIGNYFLLLLKLKEFLNISLVSVYIACGAMYIVVLLGPRSETGFEQPIILFLLFLIMWPLVMHIFCRFFLKQVRKKILLKKYSSGKMDRSAIDNEIEMRKKLLQLFMDSSDDYKHFSLIVSLLISISQIIVIFYE